MISLATLLLFSGAVLALLLSPGPNMAFVLSHGVAFGPRSGFAAACGIGVADVILTVLTATGVTAAVVAWPPSFDVLRYGGTVYLLWLAFKAVQAPSRLLLASALQPSARKVFTQSLAGSLINPKPLLFFMMFLPQFVDAQSGQIPLQIIALGLTLTAIAFLFHSVLGAFAGQIGNFLERNPRAAHAQRWALAGVLASLAVRLLFIERPTAR